MLAASPVEALRAGALVRIARTLRKMGRPVEALQVYEELSRMTEARVAGLPADLVGRRARTALLAELDRRDELRASARALQADLLARRWSIDRGTFVSYAGQVRNWTGSEPPEMAEREALSDAVDWLWQEWRRGALTPAGRAAIPYDAGDTTVLWQPGAATSQGSGDRVVALVAGPRFRARTVAGLARAPRPPRRRLRAIPTSRSPRRADDGRDRAAPLGRRHGPSVDARPHRRARRP